MRHERRAHFREAIFHAGRHFGIDFAVHKAVGFEGTERDGQHPLRDIVDGLVDVAETHRAVRTQCSQDQHRPFVAKSAEDVPDRASSCRMKMFQFLSFRMMLKLNNGYLRVSSLFRGAFLFLSPGSSTFAAQR